MKKLYFVCTVFLTSITLNAQIVNIPDPILKDRLLTGYCVDLDGDGDGDADADTNDDGEIQVSEAEAVTGLYLSCYNSSCRFSSAVGLESFVNLQFLEVTGNELVSFDVTALTNLNELICRSNDLTSLELGTISNLTFLDCTGNDLSLLDVSGLTNLVTLRCSGNPLTSLNLGTLQNLNSLYCSQTEATTLDVSAVSNLEYLDCDYGQLTELNVGSLENLETIQCRFNQITNLDVSGLSSLDVLNCADNELTTLNVNGVESLSVLYCPNNQLTTLDLDTLINLEGLTCNNNLLTELDVSALINLTSLYCGENQLNELDTGSFLNLTTLSCGNNQITELDVNNLTNLTILSVSDNNLTSIDVSNLANLNSLNCSSNQISELDLTNVTLNSLYCSNNLLSDLDVSNSSVRYLDCSNNDLITLNIKNGHINFTGELYNPYDLYLLEFSNNTNLINVCVDDIPFYFGNWPYDELNIVQNKIDQYGYSNCTVNGYCSFVPGGDYFVIEGSTTIDVDENGCDNENPIYPHLNFYISDDNISGNFISNSSGDYSIAVGEGSHTITPEFEISDYFSVSPTSITVNFPSDASPFIQDFCITPIGTFNDLEITLIPLEQARPGFDADYKLLYKNKGTTILSGSVDLTFQDDLMDLVSTNPTEDSQVGNTLTWNFVELVPFENRVILFTMNINSPMDTAPVNGDDVLVFDASVNSSETDETPDDNSFTLNQTVVNSFDPNDKTCLEGDFITPEMVGDYVHYRIRFENTGTANAINIVVKDNIDRTKFDLSTLIPIDASHEFVARIQDDADNYYVEFIFENINLPFDDANNDGYVVFKIKTLDTLVLDDVITNEAEIYFDFNFPIITDIAQTTVGTLSTEDFELADNTITLFPNPTQNTLHLKSKLAINKLVIYDIAGRRIKDIALIGSKTNVEISIEALLAGTYFIEIKTENSEIVKTFIKD